MSPNDLAEFTRTVAVMIAAEESPIFESVCFDMWEEQP